MNIDFVKLALTAVVAGFCISAAAAPSPAKAADQEVAMAKCTKDSSKECVDEDTSCAEQPSDSSKVPAPPRKSAAQKVVDGE